MPPLSFMQLLWTHWLWALPGALVGLWLVPLARFIPRMVLQGARAPLHEWQGPGGGLEQPVPPARRLWVPLLNACLWVIAAGSSAHHPFWAAILPAALASSLLLLALIDWDTTMLPDWIVLPLGLAGLFSSYAGLTRHSLIAALASAVVIFGLLGGLGLMFQRLKGDSGIGGGDIKLLAALATWWGVVGVLYILFWAGLLTVAWNLLWRRFKRLDKEAEWPFGPAIVLAALLWIL
ncbi:MAG: prepilin peptidase [Chlorobiaceae bacterium]|nr:A24 family peptidase [Chlorobiales bacterium]NTV26276.1 prepilin peptidase [Chlorobiaceae bacterium]